jgi:hypothetical protein
MVTLSRLQRNDIIMAIVLVNHADMSELPRAVSWNNAKGSQPESICGVQMRPSCCETTLLYGVAALDEL